MVSRHRLAARTTDPVFVPEITAELAFPGDLFHHRLFEEDGFLLSRAGGQRQEWKGEDQAVSHSSVSVV